MGCWVNFETCNDIYSKLEMLNKGRPSQTGPNTFVTDCRHGRPFAHIYTFSTVYYTVRIIGVWSWLTQVSGEAWRYGTHRPRPASSHGATRYPIFFDRRCTRIINYNCSENWRLDRHCCNSTKSFLIVGPTGDDCVSGSRFVLPGIKVI